jgi:23S rRNA (guanine745-N1)-methyltransferase
MTRAVLTCSVRGCAEPLEDRGATLACARGHAFDRARSGYVSLLQPQDKRAKAPGDSAASVNARRALLDQGFGDALLASLTESVAELALEERASMLDAGCGDGTFLAALCARFELSGFGVDISTHAIDAAARRHRAQTWIAANADRRLPFADASFDVVLSIDGRRNADEFARVSTPRGALIVAVPAADDLRELREAILGEAVATDRAARVEAELAAHFRLVARRSARATHRLDRAGLEQIAAATYRCARRGESARLASFDALEVTTSHDVLRFERH